MSTEPQFATGEAVLPTTGLRLQYRMWSPPGGGASSDVVLLHGLASSSLIWDLVAPLLAARGLCCLAPDQRGHGLSDKPEQGYDVETVAADAQALSGALGLRRPLVVGHSWGATIALAYGACFPQDVRGIVLVDGGVSSLRARPEASWETVEREMAPPDLSSLRMADLLARAAGGDLHVLAPDFRERFFRSLIAEQSDGTIRTRLSRANHLRILRGMWDADQDGLLGRLRAAGTPLLAVLARQQGQDGRSAAFLAAKRDGAEALRVAVPHAEVVWMDDTIHDIPLQRPDELAALIAGVAASSPTSAPLP